MAMIRLYGRYSVNHNLTAKVDTMHSLYRYDISIHVVIARSDSFLQFPHDRLSIYAHPTPSFTSQVTNILLAIGLMYDANC